MNNRPFISHTAQGASTTTVMDSGAYRVLRNTYFLLSLCLGFSALMAGLAVAFRLPSPGIIFTLIGYFGLLFLVTRYRNQGAGVLLVFALTGFMGYTLGPLLTHYLKLQNGAQIITLALGSTAVIFVGLSAYTLKTKRNLSFMGSFLTAGILVAFIMSLAALFLNLPALSLAVSAMLVLLMSGMIMFETNQIISGGETNYVMATVSLFVSLFNLFTSLLQLLGFANDD